ncbi:MAG: DUF2344 domain-containing protein, partial [Planctomycetes bacterium]|nr:DUF2344 domain-containing protein [Planctomycetota bacterium]
FMIGLPTETDEDVRAIVDLGVRIRAAGRDARGRGGQVTLSISTFVPKPHTPFQWVEMIPPDEIERRQHIIFDAARRRGLDVKLHERRGSFIEGVLARGDRRLADGIEAAYRRGARFDGWADELRFEAWQAAFEEAGIDPALHLSEIPEEARLPWDHLDPHVSVEYLRRERDRAAKGATTPSCGLSEESGRRVVICYRCGAGCDPAGVPSGNREVAARAPRPDAARIPRDRGPSGRAKEAPRRRPWAGATPSRYRLVFRKLGPMRYVSHLDLIRAVGRVLRRAGLRVSYSQGFHPKPLLEFVAPLPLGAGGHGEVVEIKLDERVAPEALLDRANAAAPEGLSFTWAQALDDKSLSLSRIVRAESFVYVHDRGDLRGAVRRILAESTLPIVRKTKSGEREIDARPGILRLDDGDVSPLPSIRLAEGERALRLVLAADAPMRPVDVLTLLDVPFEPVRLHRIAILREGWADLEPVGPNA